MKKPLALFILMPLILGGCARATSIPTETRPALPSATLVPPTSAPIESRPGSPPAGQSVTILTSFSGEQVSLLQTTFAGLEANAGIKVIVESSADFEHVALARSEAGDPYDLLVFSEPALMVDMGRRGYLADISRFIPSSELMEVYSQTWIASGMVDGKLFGIMHGAQSKSLVWYPKSEFEAAGYRVPETWDDLLALSDQIVADGGVPWCISLNDGGPGGGPGTDWVEDIMLRTTTTDNYDAWTRGELKFDSPEVRNALILMQSIWLNPDYVLGGTKGILTSIFADAPMPIFDDPPGCFLNHHAPAVAGDLPEGTKIGTDIAYFSLPPIDEAYGRPVLGTGSFVSLSKDTPRGRQVIKFMLTPASVESEVKAGELISPMDGVPMEWYPSEVHRGLAEILRTADTFRLDGSELMPDAVGSGSFPAALIDLLEGEELRAVLQAIDASWPDR